MKNCYRLKNLGSNQIYSLKQPVAVMGRNAFSDIHIDSGLLSRQHAEVRVAGEKVIIEDLNSTNGTYVNNMRIQAATELMHGDVVTVGHEKLMLIAPEKHDGSTVFTYNLSQEAEEPLNSAPGLANTCLQQSFPSPLAWNAILSHTDENAESLNKKIVQQALAQRVYDANETPAVLVVRSGGEQGNVYDFPPVQAKNSAWELGRNKFVDVVIDHPTVSNRHAKIECDGERWLIADTNSTNGLKINKKRLVTGECKSGDVISLGSLDLIFMVL